MFKPTEKQRLVLKYLNSCTSPATPTEIGQANGQPYNKASSWANSALKSLVRDGHLIRHDGGYYEAAK